METSTQNQDAATVETVSDELPDFSTSDDGGNSDDQANQDGQQQQVAQADDADDAAQVVEDAKPGNFDKGLANHTKKTAERFDKLETSLSQLSTQLQQTLTSLQAKADQGGKGAAEAAEQAEEVQSAIDDLDALEDDSIIYGEDLKKIVKKLKGNSDESKIAEIIAQQVDKALSGKAQKQISEQELASAFDQQFDTDYPALKGKADEYLQSAIDAVAEAAPDLSQDSTEWQTAVKTQLRISAKQANTSAPPAKPGEQRMGLRRKPSESTAGTGNINAGAGDAGPLAADEIGRDKDGLPDFFSSGSD